MGRISSLAEPSVGHAPHKAGQICRYISILCLDSLVGRTTGIVDGSERNQKHASKASFRLIFRFREHALPVVTWYFGARLSSTFPSFFLFVLDSTPPPPLRAGRPNRPVEGMEGGAFRAPK